MRCLGFVIALAVAACGDKTPPPDPPTPAPDPPATAPAAATTPAPTTPSFPTDCSSAMESDNKPGHHDRYVFRTDDEMAGYKNKAGEVVIKPVFLFAYEFNEHGLAAAMATDPIRPVYINTAGEVIADAKPFDNGPDYFVNGMARIVANGKVGFIDATGRIVITPRFDSAGSFCAGRAPVCRGCAKGQGGRHGYINRAGDLVIPYELESASMFNADGTARARKDGVDVTINRDGAVIP